MNGANCQRSATVSLARSPGSYRAKPGWEFLTGSKKDIESVRRAFDSYVTNKMAHQPLMLIRKPQDNSWIRIFGITSTEELLTELKKAGA